MPLLAPAASNAAIAGALAPTSTLAPDLISATVTGVSLSGTNSGTTVRFCFNKTLGSTPTATSFVIRTYRNAAVPANSASASGQCVDALFNQVFDPSTYTTGGAGNNAVVNATTGTFSNADSTALIAPGPTNNGTRGRSTAPDLVGVSTGLGTVSYTFDEALAPTPTATPPARFTVQDNTGATIATATAVAFSADRKTVTATFPSITNGVRATYTPSANPGNPAAGDLVALEAGNDPAPVSAAPLPGSNGSTTLADPIQAIVVGDGSTGTVDVVFDQPTTVGVAGSYALLLADGRNVAVNIVSQPNTNTVRVQDAGNLLRGEYIVGVSILNAAATAAPAATVGTVPAGGNTGAFATGFTTGPDATATTFDLATNTATVTLDQRYSAANAGNFFRVDNTGTVNASAATSLSFGSTATPGRTTIQANFPSLAGTRALQITRGGVSTSLLTNPGTAGFGAADRETNVDQILAPSASSAG